MRIIAFLLSSLAGSLFISSPLCAQQAFSRVFHQVKASQVYFYRISWEELLSQNSKLGEKGFQLIDLEILNEDGRVFFWGIWRETGVTTRIEQARGWDEMVELKRRMAESGFLLMEIESYIDETGAKEFVGAWVQEKLPHKLWKLNSWEELVEKSALQSDQFFQLIDIETSTNELGLTNFLAIYHKLPPSERAHPFLADNPEAFFKDKSLRIKSGYAIFDYETYQVNDRVFLLGLYKKSDQKDNVRHRLNWDSFVNYEEFLRTSLQLVDLEISLGQGSLLLPPYQLSRLEKTPNLPQSIAAASKVSVTGAPEAAANSLLWLAENGFPALSPGGEGAAPELARRLSGSAYLNTSSFPPPFASVINGLITYIEEKNYQIETVSLQDIRRFDAQSLTSQNARNHLENEDQSRQITLDFAQKGLLTNSIVLIEWGVYEPAGDSLNLLFHKVGNHWATVVGYGINEYNVENSQTLIVHSPAHGGEDPLYLKVEELDMRLRLKSNSQLIDPAGPDGEPVLAGQQSYLKNALEKEDDRFAVWERTLIIRLKDPALAGREDTQRD